MKKYLLEIMKNKEGSKLAYLSPIGKDGNTDGGYRIAGPKPWGGCQEITKLKITSRDLVEFIKVYAPEVMDELNKISESRKVVSPEQAQGRSKR